MVLSIKITHFNSIKIRIINVYLIKYIKKRYIFNFVMSKIKSLSQFVCNGALTIPFLYNWVTKNKRYFLRNTQACRNEIRYNRK